MNLLKNGSIYFGSNILNALIPFFLLPILTRYLTTEEYGEVAIFTSLAGVFSAFVGTSILGSVSRKYFDDFLSRADYSCYIGSAIQLIVFSTLFVGFLLFFLDAIIAGYTDTSSFVVWASLYLAFSSAIIQLKLNQFQIRKKAINYAKLHISWTAINSTLSVFAVVIFGFGVFGRVGAQIVACSLIFLISVYFLVRYKLIGGLFKWRLENYKELLLFGIPLLPHVLGGYLLNSVDRIIISQNLGLSAVGFYVVAFQLASASGLFFDALNKTLQPWLYENLKKNHKSINKRIVLFTYGWFLLLFFVVIMAYFLAPGFVVFIAGEKYLESVSIFFILMISQAFKGMYLSVINYCFFAKRTGYLSLISILSGVLNVVLIYFLIPILGVLGVAYAYTFSMFIRFILVWFLSAKIHPMPWLSLSFRKAKVRR